MFKVNVYLNFDGNTEEVFDYYKSIFGGEYSALMRFKEMPPSENQMPEGIGDKIMHMALPIGENTILMGSDIIKEYGQKLVEGNNIYVSLHPETVEEGKKLYDELSVGGKVEMEFDKMFWGDYYAAFTDKYGVQWMVNVAGQH